MNYYQRHIGDYVRDTSHLTFMQHGIYTKLLDLYYLREEGLPASKVAALVGARTSAEKRILKEVLDEFFVEREGIHFHARCEHEICAVQNERAKNSEKGVKSGVMRKKRALLSNSGSTVVEQAVEPEPNHGSTPVEPPNRQPPTTNIIHTNAGARETNSESEIRSEPDRAEASAEPNLEEPWMRMRDPISRLLAHIEAGRADEPAHSGLLKAKSNQIDRNAVSKHYNGTGSEATVHEAIAAVLAKSWRCTPEQLDAQVKAILAERNAKAQAGSESGLPKFSRDEYEKRRAQSVPPPNRERKPVAEQSADTFEHVAIAEVEVTA